MIQTTKYNQIPEEKKSLKDKSHCKQPQNTKITRPPDSFSEEKNHNLLPTVSQLHQKDKYKLLILRFRVKLLECKMASTNYLLRFFYYFSKLS